MIKKIKTKLISLKTRLFGKKKSAKKDFIWYLLPLITSFVFGLIKLPIIAKNISVSAYGQYDYLRVVVGFSAMFLSLGIGSALHEALYRGEVAGYSTPTVTKSIYLFWFSTSGIALAFACVAYYIILGYPTVFLFFIYLSVFSTSMQNVPRQFLRKQRRPKVLAGMNIFTNFLKVVGVLLLLFLSMVTLQTILVVGIVAAVINLFFYAYVYRDYNEGSFSWGALRESLKVGIPTLPASIADWVIKASDRFFLKNIQGDKQLGLYAMNMRYDKYMMMLLMVFNNTFYPIFGNKLSNKESEKEIEQSIFRILILFGFLLFVGAIFMKEFVLIVSRPEFYVGSWLFLIIANYIFFYLWYYLYKAHIVTSGRIKLIGLLQGAGALINLILNYFLVHWLSYIGAAISTLAAHTITIALTYLVLRKDFKIKLYKHLGVLLVMNAFIVVNILFITISKPVIYWDRIAIKVAFSILVGILAIKIAKPMELGKI